MSGLSRTTTEPWHLILFWTRLLLPGLLFESLDLALEIVKELSELSWVQFPEPREKVYYLTHHLWVLAKADERWRDIPSIILLTCLLVFEPCRMKGEMLTSA